MGLELPLERHIALPDASAEAQEVVPRLRDVAVQAEPPSGGASVDEQLVEEHVQSTVYTIIVYNNMYLAYVIFVDR